MTLSPSEANLVKNKLEPEFPSESLAVFVVAEIRGMASGMARNTTQ
jgi:hypothetical protein